MTADEKKIDEWLQMVRGKVIEQRLRAVYETNHLRWRNEPGTMFNDQVVNLISEDVYLVEIPKTELVSMYDVQDWYKRNQGSYPIDKFDELIRTKFHEEHVRNRHPGVKEAWEKYQTMLNLAK